MKNTIFDLSGRTALITGGSKGLGLAMARAFAEAGANLVIVSRHEGELTAAAKDIADGTSTKVKTIVADLSIRSESSRLASEAVAAFGAIDILVNNAGSNVPELTDKISDENWDRILELNFSSCMALARALVPQMKKRRWGRIIHISSIMALGSKEGRNAYSGTKAALIGMCRAEAIDLGPFGITSNCICPGPFLTDLPGSVLTTEQKEAFANRTALGRWGEPRELAGTALLLASNAGSYITGSHIVVDGGTMARVF